MSSTDTSDAGMYKMMGIVMAAIAVFALLCAILARIFGADAYDPSDKVMRGALIDRIAPVGKIRTAAMAEAEGEAAAAIPVVSNESRSAEELYQEGCSACHNSGINNAPKFGDAAAWTERKTAGLEALVASAIAGKGAMPAKGGRTDYSDGDIERIVQYLVGE